MKEILRATEKDVQSNWEILIATGKDGRSN
jgi:hypothetical protein